MSVEANKSNAIRLRQEGWNQGNLDTINELISPDYYYRDFQGKEFKGPEGYSLMVTNWRKAFPDCHYSTDLIIAEGDWVSEQTSFKATFKAKISNFEPTGKEVNWKASVFSRWVDGKCVETVQFIDYLNVFRQMGIKSPGL